MRANYAVPGMRQVDRDQFLDCGFVFDDENVGWHVVARPGWAIL
jgi:hypothetical protein